MSGANISVVICPHNPRREAIALMLDALRRQSLSLCDWELGVADNGSDSPLAATLDLSWHPAARVVVEPRIGLTAARLRGIAESRGALLVFVDDDNLLAPSFLAVARVRDA